MHAPRGLAADAQHHHGFRSHIQLRPVAGEKRRWELTERLIYSDPVEGVIRIAPGASTDGASIPRLLWTLVGAPLADTRVCPAAVVHDQLYCTLGLGGRLTRARADALFYRALRANGVSRLKACLYYLGVRLGGWVGWGNYASNPGAVERELMRVSHSPIH
jgi:hypothetical protein